MNFVVDIYFHLKNVSQVISHAQYENGNVIENVIPTHEMKSLTLYIPTMMVLYDQQNVSIYYT